MGTNNRGNPYSVYFGTRDHAALADGSLGADWAAPSEGYPGYLSPGSQVRSRDLSDEERERIAIRQRSEHHLAALLGATERFSQLLCLSANQAPLVV